MRLGRDVSILDDLKQGPHVHIFGNAFSYRRSVRLWIMLKTPDLTAKLT